MPKKSMINEDGLLSKLPHFFENSSSILIEIAQNAQRSGATTLNIALKDGVLTAMDNGNGTNDPSALLTLAESDWSSEIEEQMPAGWGLFFLICISESVSFKSKFGNISVDCKSFLNNKKYRNGVLDLVDADTKLKKGFILRARLKDKMQEDIGKGIRNLYFFPLDITFNGEAIKKKDLTIECKYAIKCEYEGNQISIDPYSFKAKMENSHISTVWYGIPINHYYGTSLSYTRNPIAIDVKQGNPVTPVLPYRHTIKNDEKLTSFLDFAKRQVIEYCTKKINSYASDNSTVDSTITSLMETMSKIATQEELDKLELFAITISEPYYNSDYNGDSQNDERIVKATDGPFYNEIANVILYRGEEMEELGSAESELVLPEEAIKSVTFSNNAPSWLKDIVIDKEIDIEIHYAPKETFSGNYNWSKAEIKSEKDIGILALENHYDQHIFYKNTAKDFDGIGSVVFAMRIYSDEGDLWDSQQDYYEKAINEDICKILGRFNIDDLLKGLSITGINVYKIKRISVGNKTITINMKDGEKKVLKIAA